MNNGNNCVKGGKSSKGWFGGKSSKGSNTNLEDTERTRNSHPFESSNSHNRFVEPSSSNSNFPLRRRHTICGSSSRISQHWSIQSSQASNSHPSLHASNLQYSGTTASSGSVTPLNSNIRSSIANEPRTTVGLVIVTLQQIILLLQRFWANKF